MTVNDEDLLRHLVSWEFNPTRAPMALPTGRPVSRLAGLVRAQRVTGVALAALDDGALVAPPQELSELLGAAHVNEMQRVLTAECDLVRVARLLERSGIDFRVLKGLASAHLDHEDPALRSTSDVDLLVRPVDLARTVEELHPLLELVPDTGGREVSNPFSKDLTLKVTNGGWLDLHQLIAPAYWGLSVDAETLFESSESYVIAGTEILALDRRHRLIHALLHAGYSDDISMHSVRDCVVLASALGDSLNETLESVSNRPISGLLAIGAQRTVECLGLDHPLRTWAADVTPTTRERIALRLTKRTGRGSYVSGMAAVSVRRWPTLLRPVVRSRLRSSRQQ